MLQVQVQVHWQSLVLMLRFLPSLLLLGAGPPAPVLRLQGNWQSLAPPLRLDWTCFSLGQRRRLSLTSLAQRRVGLCSTATSPASHAITLAPCTIVVTVFTEATVLVPGVTASSRAVTPVRPWPTWVAGLVPPFNSNGNRPGPRWHMHWQSLVRGANAKHCIHITRQEWQCLRFVICCQGRGHCRADLRGNGLAPSRSRDLA